MSHATASPAPVPNLFILYVRSAAESAAFYARLLDRPPLEASPGFALFDLQGGAKLGLWSAAGVQPSATPAGGSELAMPVPDVDSLDALHRQWCALGLPIAQPPTDMDFGHTFVALDPDGHRLRVFAAAGA